MQLERRYLPLLAAGLIFAFAMLVTLMTVTTINGGHLVYALDDPYIHLALARQVAQGHYGINPGEFSAPASSILYPLLLAPFFWLRLPLWGPLVLNLAAALASLFVLWLLLERGLRGLPEARRRFWTGVVLILSIATFNLVGQVLEGMEHLLQLWASLLVLWGIRRVEDEGRLPPWLPAALVLGPLLRYENLMVSILALVYLLWRGRLLPAALTLVALMLTLGGFTLFLKAHGLGPLPTSILAKSSTGSLAGLWANTQWNVNRPEGQCLLAATLLALGLGAWRRGREGGMLAALSCIPLTHLVFGAVGFGRYEIYALALATIGALLMLGQVKRGALLGLAPLVMLVLGHPYLNHTLAATRATHFVYEQQYQMARFVREYVKKPVAVNDIGLVAYEGDQYVLDLWGLACKEALDKHRTEKTNAWMGELAKRQGVAAVMLYDWWFHHDLPPSWIKVGELYLSQPGVYVSGNIVSFYATEASGEATLRRQLKAFRPTLPPGVSLVLTGEALPN